MWCSDVRGDKIDVIWKIVLPDLRELISKQIYSEERILQGLKLGEFQLWVIGDGPKILVRFITEIKSDTVYIHLMAGSKLKEVFESGCFRMLGDWSKRVGANRIHSRPRRGLAKLAEKYWGFKKLHAVPNPDQTGAFIYELDLRNWI